MSAFLGYANAESYFSAMGVDPVKLEKDQIQARAKAVAARVDRFFEDLKSDPSVYAANFEPDPIKCLGLGEYIDESHWPEVGDALRSLVPQPSEVAPLNAFTCAWCKGRTFVTLAAIGVGFPVLIAAAGAILGGLVGGPAGAIMGAILGALAAIGIVVAAVVIAELIVGAFGYTSLAEAICYLTKECP
jgi:hypothetical protein